MVSKASCASCGAPIDAGAQFCKQCGSNVSGQQGNVATQVVKPSTTQQVQAQLLQGLRDATLGDYEVLAELGRGGMATVYLGHDIQLDRKVAIKVMNPALVHGEGMVERFKLEARTAAGLSHPHIIPIYAVKQTDDLLYFVMKFIEGRPLDSIIKEAAPLPVAMVRTVVAKVGEALGYAHRRGVIHRDIKPANIMIDSEGMPIVTDFGIAKVADQQGLTMTGATIGTPTYMSPEQCNAQTITGASDQYSLGVLAYEMLTGQPLYDGDSVMTIMFKHVHEEPPTLDAFPPEVPREIAQVVTKMLSKNPADRFETIEAALPMLMSGALAYDDTVRTQLVEFARHSPQKEVLKRVSTPRSPIPATQRSAAGAIDSAATVRLSSGRQRPATRPGAAAAPKQRTGLWLVLVVLAIAGGATAWAFLAGPLARSAPADAQPPGVQQPVAGGEPALGPAAPAAGPEVVAADSAGPAPAETPPAQVSRPAASRPAATAPVQVASVQIVGAPATLQAGGSVALSATARDARGRAVERPVRWSSTNPGVASVDATGVLRGVSAGTATITAVLDSRSDRVTVTVSPVPVASVSVAPAQAQLEVGATVQLAATLVASDGSSVTGRAISWSSNNPSVASVTAAGLVSAVGAGSAVVTATSDSRSGAARITVTAPVAAVDNRALVEQTIDAYARALEAGDLAGVRRVFPGIPSDRERALRGALEGMRDLQVRMAVGSVVVDGGVARAQVSQRWTFFNTASRSNGDLAMDNTFVLQRRADAWVITEIR